MLSCILAVSTIVAVATAQNLSTWSPAGPGDVRSPCPGLNSLANHGILPHNGKGMTISILVSSSCFLCVVCCVLCVVCCVLCVVFPALVVLSGVESTIRRNGRAIRVVLST